VTRPCTTPGCDRPAKRTRRKCGPCIWATRHETPVAAVRMPVQPLIDWVHATVTGEPVPITQAAKILDVDPAQIHRWLRIGVRLDHADRAAIRLGVHPTAIWGDHWWTGTEATRMVARGRADTLHQAAQLIEAAYPPPAKGKRAAKVAAGGEG
jgi:hypothetical protein